MDRKKGLLNVGFAIFFRLIGLILNFFALRALIHSFGVEYQGYNTLFNSLMSILALAELGFAGGIAFSLYEPIVHDDKRKVSALYHYLKRIYFWVALAILALGIFLIPFLSFFSGVSELPKEVVFAYLFYVLSSSGVYFFSAKSTLISAYKDNYKRDFASSSGLIVQHLLQIVFVYFCHSYLLFACAGLIGILLQTLIVNCFVKHDHKEILKLPATLGEEEKRTLWNFVKATLFHRVGNVAINMSDSLVISIFLSLASLGYYANYNTIAMALVTTIGSAFSSLASIIGHSFYQNDKKKFKHYFNILMVLSFSIAGVIFLGYAGAANSFVNLFYGAEYRISTLVLFLISLLSFFKLLLYAITAFKDATGVFYQERFVPLLVAILNIVFKVFLASTYGIEAILSVNIVTFALIFLPLSFYYLYRYAFQQKVDLFLGKLLLFILIFVGFLILTLYLENLFVFDPLPKFFIFGFFGVFLALLNALLLFLSEGSTRNWFKNLYRKKRSRASSSKK